MSRTRPSAVERCLSPRDDRQLLEDIRVLVEPPTGRQQRVRNRPRLLVVGVGHELDELLGLLLLVRGGVDVQVPSAKAAGALAAGPRWYRRHLHLFPT